MSELALDPYRWEGMTVVDPAGEKVGRVSRVCLEAADHRPQWLVISGGLLGVRQKWVPVVGIREIGDQLHTEVPAERIQGAPSVDASDRLDPEAAAGLYDHYGIAAAAQPSQTRPVATMAGADEQTGDEAMTRAEEELLLGRSVRPTERVRLVKHVVTEERQLTVRLRHEQLRVERVPYGPDERTEQERPGELGEADEAVGEVVLFEEQPVVVTRLVPKERVRLVKSTVAEERTVKADVLKERIDLEQEPLR